MSVAVPPSPLSIEPRDPPEIIIWSVRTNYWRITWYNINENRKMAVKKLDVLYQSFFFFYIWEFWTKRAFKKNFYSNISPSFYFLLRIKFLPEWRGGLMCGIMVWKYICTNIWTYKGIYVQFKYICFYEKYFLRRNTFFWK